MFDAGIAGILFHVLIFYRGEQGNPEVSTISNASLDHFITLPVSCLAINSYLKAV